MANMSLVKLIKYIHMLKEALIKKNNYYGKQITLKEHNAVFVRKNLTKNVYFLKVNNYYIYFD